MESELNGLAFALLLTSLFVLRFRGWKKPWAVAAYFAFFVTLEIAASHYFMPPGAFGPGLAIVCFVLTIPVLIAAYLVWRHEQRHDESGD
ncbi:MAG TPA: hypothetical protein ENI85_10655 [Deltaproteobacteria bacterium]|nr:hypothetical protein [Deltaproteobacteria bacterium]